MVEFLSYSILVGGSRGVPPLGVSRFLDVRTMRYTHELRVSPGSAGVIRCLAVGPSGNWLAVGHSSGVLSVLDVRTGFLLGSWVAHDGEILQASILARGGLWRVGGVHDCSLRSGVMQLRESGRLCL